jgi:hypothetical protein
MLPYTEIGSSLSSLDVFRNTSIQILLIM